MKTYLLDDLLVKMDRMSMANSLEARSPFLDKDLIGYVASLPDSMKLKGWRTKYILKKAFSDILPKEIQTRGKMGFGVPLGAWFRTELRDYIHDALLSTSSRVKEYLSQDRIREIIEENEAMRRDYGLPLWNLLQLELWLRNFPG
jgi:asparagine synthase (glutamine-hydrolysing)